MIVAGNLLYDGSHYYFYDAENHLIQVDGTLGYCTAGTGTAATACYVYDAEGHRVHRTGVITDTCDGTGKRDYVFDLAGNWVGEYSSNGNGCKSEIYAGSRHLVTYAGGTPLFIHSDWLGTVRLRNNATYPTYNFQTCTSLPFGDALTCAGASQSTLHFTGKERDAESGLDNFGARFDSSSMGRFMSPDPINLTARRLVNPSNTLNKYAYAANNPIKYVDPNGKDITIFYSNTGFSHIYFTAFNQATGEVRSLDSNPQMRGFWSDVGTLSGSSSTPNFAPPKDPSIISTDNYASLTIRTSPEEAQRVIEWIDQYEKHAADYNFYSNNCTTVCAQGLQVLGIKLDLGGILDDPDDAWDQLFDTFANPNVTGFHPWHAPAQPGKEYGFQRYPEINTNQLADLYFRLFLYQNQKRPRACVEAAGVKTCED